MQTALTDLSPERVLVIRLGALGDVVRTRFAFAGLRERFPEAEIDWLVDDRAAAGLDGIVGLRDVVRVPRRALSWGKPGAAPSLLRGVGRDLRGRRYDLVVDFHGVARSAWWCWMSRAPVRVGFGGAAAREGAAVGLTHPVAVDPAYTSRFERNATLVRALGGEVPERRPRLALSDAARALGAGLSSRPVLMHPGTSARTLYKRWDLARYAELARRLGEDFDGGILVSYGGAEERRSAAQVVEASDGAARLAPETPTIAALLGLLERTRLFVGNDSGPLHLASLAGVPIVGLFGPTDPVENRIHPGSPSSSLRHDVGCNPCRLGCPARSCMRSIEVDEVLASVRALLDSKDRPG